MNDMVFKSILVVIGGGLGALSRYHTSLVAVKIFGDRFPFGTLLVNLTGCLVIGILFTLGNDRNIIGPETRLFLMTGFLGGLTTFSSYGLESVNFARSGSLDITAINFLANNVGGYLLVFIGLRIGKLFS